MKAKYWIILLVVMLLSSNLYWLYALLDAGVTMTYQESDIEMTSRMYDQTIKLANLQLIGMKADEAMKLIGKDVYGSEPFEKEDCIYAAQVCVRLNDKRIVIGIGKNDL